MKNKFAFIFATTAISFLFGKFLLNEIQNPQRGIAYAQVEPLDKEAEKKRNDKKNEPILEEKETTKEATKDQKVVLPTKMPPVKPETFRMFETIEKKNKELKRREEELKIKEEKIKAIEAKVKKNLEKIEKRISKSKQQLGMQNEKTKENVQTLVKVYSSMKPGEAAKLIEAIDEDLALKIVSGMKSKIAGQVLSQLDVKVAKRISETLAGKTKDKKE